MDLDVLDVWHFQQRLQPSVTEDCVLDRMDVRLLLGCRPQVGSLTMERPDVITDDALDDRAAQQQPVIADQAAHRRYADDLRFAR